MSSKSNWLTKSLKNFDFLGQGINFTINNEPHLKTVCGGVLRLILYILGIFLFFFFGEDFLFKKNPQIYYEIKESSESLTFNFSANDFFFALRFENIDGLKLDISEYFHVESINEKVLNEESSVLVLEKTKIPLIPCSNINFDSSTENRFKELNKSDYLCPQIEKGKNMTISGNWDRNNKTVSIVDIKLKLCLSLDNKSKKNCKNYKKFSTKF